MRQEIKSAVGAAPSRNMFGLEFQPMFSVARPGAAAFGLNLLPRFEVYIFER